MWLLGAARRGLAIDVLIGVAVDRIVGWTPASAGKVASYAFTGVSPTTAAFVTEAAVSDLFEIDASKMAVDKPSGATKEFATKMIADHEKRLTDLKTLLKTAVPDAVIPPDVFAVRMALAPWLRCFACDVLIRTGACFLNQDAA